MLFTIKGDGTLASVAKCIIDIFFNDFGMALIAYMLPLAPTVQREITKRMLIKNGGHISCCNNQDHVSFY
jgi:hypothetical protein